MKTAWLRKPGLLNVCAASGVCLVLAAVGWPAYEAVLDGQSTTERSLAAELPKETPFVAAPTSAPPPPPPVEMPTTLEPKKESVVFSVESRPKGAIVEINGEVRGVTPFLGSQLCTKGETVVVKVSLDTYKPFEGKSVCGDKGVLRVRANLRRQSR
jgi:hypothetical protein